ncbi:hypothetical protein ACVJMZ_001097 [Sinorhizobium medicae]
MPGDIGLQRELVQEGLAKGMNGLDLQAARRFQGPRKQPPRLLDLAGGRSLAFDRLDPFFERSIVEGRPFGELLEHTVGHLGGGCLRIGQA